MLDQARKHLTQGVNEARKKSRSRSVRRRFRQLSSTSQIDRATFFSEMTPVIASLGLSNPHEETALGLEPPHPVPPCEIRHEVEKLEFDPLVVSRYDDARLSLVYLKLVEGYAHSLDTRMLQRLLRKNKAHSPFYLLDPLYGFVFLLHHGQVMNHCLAIEIWQKHLSRMPRSLARELWKNKSDRMLSAGAFAGRHILGDLIAEEKDQAKLPHPPEIVVESHEELTDLVEEVSRRAADHDQVQIWFRGQTQDYQTPDRLDLARIGLTPYSNIRESDLTPSLYRKYDGFLESLEEWSNFIVEMAEWSYWANSVLPDRAEVSLPYSGSGPVNFHKSNVTSYQRGLLLQQYGSPSAYLDITRDADIAAWFATHRLRPNRDGSFSYDRLERAHVGSPAAWPTIYVFPLVPNVHPFLDLETILGGWEALRPARQKCGLLGGAGNLARNFCSRYVGLKIRLSPDFILPDRGQLEQLFPSPSEDPLLGKLLNAGLGARSRKLRAFVVSQQTKSCDLS